MCVACAVFSPEAKLEEHGATPYVRCIAAPAPEDRTGQAGAVHFEQRGRDLTLTPKRMPIRVAAFSGAGFAWPPRAAEVTALRQANADLFVMLGGLGAAEAGAIATARALASLERPVLVLLGGRDTRAATREALADHDRLIDATTLRRIRIQNHTFVPVAGAAHGRYAVGEGGCGFGGRDLDALAQDLGAPGPAERRWLLSWHAPAAGPALPGAALSAGGVDLGSHDLGRLAQRLGVTGSLSAWPPGDARVAAGPLQAQVVPRAFGPLQERPDGSRLRSGVLVLELDDQGLRVVP